MSYEKLVSEFVEDNVFKHSPLLRLHNPHFDKRLKFAIGGLKFENGSKKLDWLHDKKIKDLGVQFIGSHYSNLKWLVDEEDRMKIGYPTNKVYPFYARLAELKISDRFRLGNCALGYVPDLERTTGHFNRNQIEYLHPKKMREYEASRTRAVFTLGWPSLHFHLYGTGRAVSKFADTVDDDPISLTNGLLVIPLPHPGNQGIMNYLRARGKVDRSKDAQDIVFRKLVNKGLHHLPLAPI